MALYILIFTVLVIFFPITTTVYIYFNKSERKLYFAIYLFKYFSILCGYITVRNAYSVYLHIKNKAYIITLSNLIKLSKGNGGGNFFSPLSLFLYVDSAVKFSTLSFLMLLNSISSIFNAYIYNDFYYFNYFYSFNLINNYKKQTSIKLAFTLTFNIFCILKVLIANYIIKGVKSGKNSRAKSGKLKFNNN